MSKPVIVSKWAANYLIVTAKDYKPNLETLYFGHAEIKPGQKIKKIGKKIRSSFESRTFIKYEGTIHLENIKYCLFSSTWKDKKNEPIYRYAFAMSEGNKPTFLYVSNKTGQNGKDIDCTIVELISD